MASGIYSSAKAGFMAGSTGFALLSSSAGHPIDLDTDTIRAFLVISTYTPAFQTDDYLSDIPTASRLGVTAGTGYNQGKQVTGISASVDGNGILTMLAQSPVVFDALAASASVKGMVMYKQGSSADTNSPLIAFFEFATVQSVAAGQAVSVLFNNQTGSAAQVLQV